MWSPAFRQKLQKSQKPQFFLQILEFLNVMSTANYVAPTSRSNASDGPPAGFLSANILRPRASVKNLNVLLLFALCGPAAAGVKNFLRILTQPHRTSSFDSGLSKKLFFWRQKWSRRISCFLPNGFRFDLSSASSARPITAFLYGVAPTIKPIQNRHQPLKNMARLRQSLRWINRTGSRVNKLGEFAPSFGKYAFVHSIASGCKN